MAYAKNTYTGDGATTQYSISFNYLLPSHITVIVNEVTQTVDVDYTVNTSTNKVVFTTAPTDTYPIVIKRVTPKDYADFTVVFSDGSARSASDLNSSIKHLLYVSQEMLDSQAELGGYSVIDDDTMATASASSLATSESIKAYVDAVASFSVLTADLNVSGYDIVSSAGVNIDILPGSGGEVNIGNILNVDNLALDGNTLKSTDTNGNVYITPNGSGSIIAGSVMDIDSAIRINNNVISSIATDANISLAPNGTGSLVCNKQVDFGNLTINATANQIESTDTNGDINIVPDGTGQIKLKYAKIPSSTGSTGQSLRLGSGGDFEWFTATTGGIGNVVEDTSPQLGGDLDANAYDIQFDDATGIRDDSDNEQLIFQKTTSAVNHIEITNAATGNAPSVMAAGDDANVDLVLDGKGTGQVSISNAFKLPTSDGTSGQVLETDGAGSVTWSTPTVANPVGSFKNKVINGSMDIWQRNTSFVSIAHNAYSADRWVYTKSGVMVHDVSRSTDVPSAATANNQFNYSLLVDCTTADTSIAAGDYCAISQRIEGYNIRGLSGQSITLSFWVKATKTGTYCVSLVNNGSDRSYVAEYTVSVTDTWEKKSVTFSDFSSAGGTWDYTSNTGLTLGFTLACGSTYQTTAGSWQTGNFIATSSQVNATDSASNNFRLTGVQLEVGTSATDMEARSYQEEFMLCQRYYEKSQGNKGSAASFSGDVTTPAFYFTTCMFTVDKRAAPTMTNAGATYNVFTSISTIDEIDTKGFRVSASAPSTGAGGFYFMDWTAESEL